VQIIDLDDAFTIRRGADRDLECLQVLRGKGNCIAGHVGPNFTDEGLHNTGAAWADGTLTDRGAGQGTFKTPTLREVARTARDLHDGSMTSLEDVVNYYDRGGNANPWLDPELRRLNLTDGEKHALVAFVRSPSEWSARAAASRERAGAPPVPCNRSRAHLR
jgi:cytochrome c peroxidase